MAPQYVTSSAPCKHVVPPATCPVEGAGSLTFSNNQLIGAIAAVPLVVTVALGVSLAWYPLVFLLTALPSFAAYNLYYATIAAPVRVQKGLPGKSRDAYLKVTDPALAAKFPAKIPMETFFEAYFDQKIELAAGKDLMDVLEHRYEWASFVFTWGNAKFFLTQWIPETLWHSKKQDEDQVREHYDRGDDFYNWFLGPRMIYTSGIITDTTKPETLEQLQDNKLNLVCDKINLKKGDRMLDIGCGWGTLSVHAAKRGAKVTGVTLGRNQTAWGMGKASDAGVADNVRILCMDYRDIPKEKYDKITCLEMAEHVGVRKFQEFLIQDLIWGLFMAKYVFPGADASAPLNWVLEQAERAGYEVAHCDTIGVHYSATIYRWYLNWMQNKEKVIGKYGVRWFRVWELFLAWSSIVARQGSATCYQIVLHKNLNTFDRNQFISRRTNASSY
ncbi:S-adenosyl-L-methionine-dependent methyltransferase [Obelidium mucronatum]|nr:S-adenosyl-L-methionine-dependent methyltransferase [Obelidium mucronatum]